MGVTVELHTDPRAVTAAADAFLASEPVRHNLVATLLDRCAAAGGTGRFWIARDDTDVVGLAFQWPEGRSVVLTPMTAGVAAEVAEAVVDAGGPWAGVNGEVTAASAFAGRWTERTEGGAQPTESLRLLAVDAVATPRSPAGSPRAATKSDAALLAGWTAAFSRETGEVLSTDPMAMVALRTAAGELWVWDDDGPVTLLGTTASRHGAVRIGPVYTPPEQRGRGYASALTAHCSAAVRATGDRCLLYADLANPTSNGVYRAVGYRAVAETLRYDFDPAG